MLSYEKIQQGLSRDMMPFDAIHLLHHGLEQAHVRRSSATLEVKHYIEQKSRNRFTFDFFFWQPMPVTIQVAQKYLDILQGKKDVTFTSAEKKALNAMKDDEFILLIEKHQLITITDEHALEGLSWAWR